LTFRILSVSALAEWIILPTKDAAYPEEEPLFGAPGGSAHATMDACHCSRLIETCDANGVARKRCLVNFREI
jgi:hypothetical protein